MLATMNSCFGLFRPRQRGIASKQAQFPKERKYLWNCGAFTTKQL